MSSWFISARQAGIARHELFTWREGSPANRATLGELTSYTFLYKTHWSVYMLAHGSLEDHFLVIRVPCVGLKRDVFSFPFVIRHTNRKFPSSLVPLFQIESQCETFHMKMSSACSFIFMQIKVIFKRLVSQLDSPWNRGARELGNGLLVFRHFFRD